MYREEDLKNRAWPRCQGRDEMKAFFKYARYTAYVREGHVVTRALRLPESLSDPIPPGECAITSLCRSAGGRVYGATSGTRSHFFCYDPGPGGDGVCDVGVIEGATAVGRALAAAPDGCVYGGVSDGPGRGHLFRYRTGSDVMGEGMAACGAIELLDAPLQDEGVAGLVCDGIRGLLYGVGRTSGTLFSFEPSSGRVERKGRLDEDGYFSETLVMDGDGNVFACGAWGRLLRYSPSDGRLERLDAAIPGVAGRELYNRLDSAVWSAYDGLIYGGGSADGTVFALDPRTLAVTALGKVTAAPGCPAMAAGADGRVYGLNGTKDGMAHLFRYDPDTRSLDDLGILYARSEVSWHGYEFSAMCAGPFGEIYCGESDRISHLFIYFPPIVPRTRAGV